MLAVERLPILCCNENIGDTATRLSLKAESSLLCPKQNAMQVNDGVANREYFMRWRSQISLWKHMPAHLSQTGCGALYLQHISNTSALSLPEIFTSPSLSPSQLIFTVSFLPQMLLPSFLQNIVVLYQENQKHLLSPKPSPSPPAAFPFPSILLGFMKGGGGNTLRWWY